MHPIVNFIILHDNKYRIDTNLTFNDTTYISFRLLHSQHSLYTI